jgi:alpha-glucosidase
MNLLSFSSFLRFGLALLAISTAAAQNAPKEYWLDEMPLNGVSTGFGEVRKNRSAGNKPMTIGGTSYPRGLGVHAPSTMFFIIGDDVARFQAKVGVDGAMGSNGSVAFQIIADGETLYDSGVMRGGESAKEIDVDLSKRKIVEFRVTDGGDGMNYDHADWADAVFTAANPPQQLPRWAMNLPHFKGDPATLALKAPLRVIASPDGKVKAEFGVVEGRLVLRVTRDGKVALESSPLGMIVNGNDCGAKAVIGEAKKYTVDETYPWLGNAPSLRNQCQGEQIEIRNTDTEKTWTLDVRAYNDGVAWRYLWPSAGIVTGEMTAFVLPEGSAYWTHHNTVSYESNFIRYTPESDAAGRPITMPVTVELAGGGYTCITESDTMHYSGMTLGPRGKILHGIFEDDTQGWTMQGQFGSPWRIVIAVPDLNALVNQSISFNVAPAPDPQLFPKGALTEWIKPGRSYWTWGFGQWDSAKWELIKGFIDDAASLNCEYYVIDDPWREQKMGWHRDGKDEWASLKEFADYAKTKNVGLMVWEHYNRLKTLSDRETFFSNVGKAGAVGVKLDFMDAESHDRLEFYRSCLELGAKHKIQVNFHGANKPAGEERTWPNGLTREGIYGMEQQGGIQRRHLAALPFTRLVTGAGDFTTTAFRSGPMNRTTAGSQLATAVVYNSPLHHWFESAKTYLAQPPEVVTFIKTKPVVWDETLVLPGSKIGDLAVVARRSGTQWWIGGINGTDNEMPYKLDLPFLKTGNWVALQYEDAKGDKTKLKIDKAVTKAGDNASLSLTMQPGGGFVAILTPAP